MKIITEFPYDKYDGYVLINNENRRMIMLKNTSTNERTTTSYARYLMSVKLGRLLNNKEQVDHIDEDKTNDNIDNLQILSGKENSRKHIIINGKSEKKVELNCPNCNISFIRQERQTFIGKKGLFTCCSRECLHEFLKKGKSKEELRVIGASQIIKYFR